MSQVWRLNKRAVEALARLFFVQSRHKSRQSGGTRPPALPREAEMSLYCQGCKSLLAELEFDRGFIAGLIFGTVAVWLVWLVAVW